ncbi:MAG: hypothetical protein AUF79_08015 [Crenarchaeota archaeon 13_1_20CM_2_51_8]|nr:MAG: hypothetical protein AUF79_08015 [Crenarchaeota archaeon 13_1_20CM_2_51_8]
MNELNVERFELELTGRLKFSHPPGPHDYRLWAFAMAVYYARLGPLEYHPVAAVGAAAWRYRPSIDLRKMQPGY